MWRIKAVLIGFLCIFVFGELIQVSAVQVTSNTKMRRVSGVISWIDVKLGRLQLQNVTGEDTRGITQYRINLEETLVTDPSDKKFLVIKDLRAGQPVTIELIDSPRGTDEETMARKIIAYPMPAPILREAIGQLEAIDAQAGTLIISQKPPVGGIGSGNLYFFVFEPTSVVVMRAPSMQPVELVVKPGDMVKVDYFVSYGMRHVQSITLLETAPETTRTTTTTTTTTSTRKIIVEPIPAPDIQEATGELEAIDIKAGTLVVEQTLSTNGTEEKNLFFFVFEPKDIVIMKAPSMDPVPLELNPGDIVKVAFMVDGGKRHARNITLVAAAPETESTTKTTTTDTVTTTTR
jgi:hypothetical protein